MKNAKIKGEIKLNKIFHSEIKPSQALLLLGLTEETKQINKMKKTILIAMATMIASYGFGQKPGSKTETVNAVPAQTQAAHPASSISQDKKMDKANIKQNGAEAAAARANLRNEKAALKADEAQLDRDQKANNQAAIAQDKAKIEKDHAQIHASMHTIERENGEIKATRKDMRQDTREMQAQHKEIDAQPKQHQVKKVPVKKEDAEQVK